MTVAAQLDYKLNKNKREDQSCDFIFDFVFILHVTVPIFSELCKYVWTAPESVIKIRPTTSNLLLI